MLLTPTTIGVFPLPICLLPQGVTRLSIFEPRYQRLVSDALKNNGFALSCLDDEKPFQSSSTAALVDIIDFSKMLDGTLTIDIKARNLATLSQFYVEADGLRRAEYEVIDHWSDLPIVNFPSNALVLAQTLSNIIDCNKPLQSLYPRPRYHDLSWICARYIELLPISLSQKKQLIFEQSFDQLQVFLHTVITGKD
jgi:Lon protease-like protein